MSVPRASWNVTTSLGGLRGFVVGDELAADLSTSNRLTDFEVRHPERFFNTGIAEQNMMSIGAGLAACGHQAWVSTFAAFASLLCAEHLRADIVYPQLPVRVMAHHAGISMGFYGTSHHAVEDIAVTRSIAGMAVMAPCDAASVRACVRATLDEPGPVYLRLGRGSEPDVYAADVEIRRGHFICAREGDDVTVIATGIGVPAAIGAAERMSGEDVTVRVLDAVYLKPLDVVAIEAAARETGRILVVEEHNVIGGLGTAVAETVGTLGLSAKVAKLGIDDQYVLVAPPSHLYRHYGLTSDGVVRQLRALLDR